MRRVTVAAALGGLAGAGLTGLLALVIASQAGWEGWRALEAPRSSVPPDPPAVMVVTGPDLPRQAPDDALPDVLLVLACTVRRDQLPMHGGPASTTPALAALAADGATFGDLIAAAPWTRPASAAILTGQHAVSLGMVEPGPSRSQRRLPDRVTTLAEHLRAAGYHTVGATANPNLNAAFGFHQGFDRYLQLRRLWRDDMVKLDGHALLGEVRPLLGDEPDRPRFLQVMLVDAHAPHDAGPDEIADFEQPGLPSTVAAYRASLRRLDEAVAEVLQEASRPDRPLLTVIVSDHGEGLAWPAHHGRAHGRFLAPSAVGATWVVHGPGVGRGVAIDGVASHVDVVPTVLGLLGLDGYEGPGVDHSALLAAGGTTARTEAFSDTWFFEVDRSAIYTPTVACQLDFQGAVAPFVDGCFDRAADPDHATPIVDAATMARLRSWRDDRARELREVGPTELAVPPDELEALLEALGYVEP